jgi:DNA-binding beta-propeller fold protein YncE
MGGLRERAGAGAAAALVLLPGCQSHVPFYRPGQAGAGGPMAGLGGPAPYVTLARPRPDALHSLAAREKERITVHSATGRGMLAPHARGLPARAYLSSPESGTVLVLDQRTFRIMKRLRVGGHPRLILPSADLRRLLVDVGGGTLVPVDPATGNPGRPVRVGGHDLYFTPDGLTALVLADGRIDVRDLRTLKLLGSFTVPCARAGPADFTADGGHLLAGCPATGRLLRIDPARRAVTGQLTLSPGANPQSIRLAPDGGGFYVADQAHGGVWKVDAATLRTTAFLRTGHGARALQPSHDRTRLFVTNSADASVSVIDTAAHTVIGRWRLPRGATPTAAALNTDGTRLWLSGNRRLYVLDTRTGRLVHQLVHQPLPQAALTDPALCLYPQPGRRSLGHTGLFR